MPFIAFGAWIAIVASPLSDPRFPAAMSLLAQVQIKRDTAGLIRCLRERTPDAARMERIELLVRRLGDPRFAVRNQATDELAAIGAVAEKALEAAVSDPDAERADRAQHLLKSSRENPDASSILAALLLLSYSGSHEAVGAIFAYLPSSNDPAVLNAAKESLLRLGMKDGKAIPEIAAWASDPEKVRRSLAGYLVGRSVDLRQQEIAQRLLEDSDPWVRLRTAEGMLFAGKETAVPAIIELLDPKDPDRSWAAQSLLGALFGGSFPDAPNSSNPNEWSRYRLACCEWWKQSEAGIDRERLPKAHHSLGLVIGINHNAGRIWGYGRNGKRLWEIIVTTPADARWLSDRKVLVAQCNPNRIYECDMSGKITWEKLLPATPVSCDRLANGDTFIGLTSSVLEMSWDGTIRHQYQFPFGAISASRRLPNGHFIAISMVGAVAELDAKGKLLNEIQIPVGGIYGDIACNHQGHYVVTRFDGKQILEFDRRGKVLSTVNLKIKPWGLDILEDGNLLLTAMERTTIISSDGKVRKEFEAESISLAHAHMR